MKKSTKVLLYAIPSILLLSCGGGLLGFAHKSRTDRDLAVARLAELGLPTDPEQIKHLPDTNKDAGTLLKKFSRALDRARETPAGMAYFDFRKKDLQSRRVFIKVNPYLVQMRQQLFTKSEFATQVEPSRSFEHGFPEFGTFRNVVNLAIAEAQVLASNGQPTKALQLLTEASKFARLLHTDPNRLAEFLSLNIQSTINRRAAMVFTSFSRRPEVQQEMQRFMKESDARVDFRRWMIGDVSDSLALEQAVRNGKFELGLLAVSAHFDRDSIWDNVMSSPYKINGVREMLFARLYNGYGDLYQSIPTVKNQYLKRIAAAERWDSEMTKNSGPNTLLLSRIISDYTHCFILEAQLKAEWRTLNALLTASEMKSKTGKYPATLPVTGQDAIDPFTDKPLKYLLKGEKLTIYSVGEDLSDDNGLLFRPTASLSSGSSSRAQDTGFSIPYVVPQRLQ